ncbi:extracellular solute-binding protein [Frigidibacter albus]|uniref:Extracellular solute-binding protein n=1 Tax=Frigidibacter albus TaxID=1465486 RepID=A0A6L8VDE9_9RHOB|nr:ABC transporter substrate-binding protein [Frigidibacter albus]MZQ88214.1 extracellular solute-binding protein [Frigidibacter albus]NBE30112.1 extracellular solute-binding protein [Frigidibacter albus]GGH46767.1 iron ABC transporter substrate-binding protein [Frigidibacter albus]
MKSTVKASGAFALAALLASTTLVQAQSLAEIETAAKAEGMLTTIALPHSWCGYGDVIAGFKAKYPEISVNELNPDAGSADELEAVRANKDNKGPQAPDVLDVGLSFGPAAQAEGLLQPYKVATWDTIPEDAKDADGNWYGDYYGVMAFVVNTDLVPNPPMSFEDLLKPEYAGQVALAGDPRASNQAILGVLAAGMARGAEPGAEAAEAGLAFFKELNEAGNFVPVIGKAGTLAQGTTPIVIAWDYNALSWRDGLNGNPPADVIVPSDVTLAGVYVQAISAYAPQPNAAKLWMEYLYSDEGQLGWLAGYCHPIRFNDLVAKGVVPQDMLDKLPPADAYERAVFPSIEAVNANSEAVKAGWDSVVGANVVE